MALRLHHNDPPTLRVAAIISNRQGIPFRPTFRPERIQGFGGVRVPNRTQKGLVLVLGKTGALEWRNPAYEGIQSGQRREGFQKAIREFFGTTIHIDLYLQLAAGVGPAPSVNSFSLLCHRWPSVPPTGVPHGTFGGREDQM